MILPNYTSTSVQLSWSPSINTCVNYSINYIDNSVIATQSPYTLMMILSNTTYNISVAAIDAAGVIGGEYSNVVCVLLDGIVYKSITSFLSL